MSSKIQLLSEHTINQIAAGEVIENPASVVKELVENAIDAGASHVAIEILSGGFQKIKVTDNGSGMSAEDALLCLKRHATSKIADAKDLFNLVTMGFRGEALASIAAVSKLSLLSALENAPANLIEAEGGIVLRAGPGARSRGTTIEVRSLFYNVPARKKFQKSAAASSAEITKIVTQLALAHPEVGFELTLQNRSQFSLPPGHGEPFLDLLKRRAAALLGTEFLNASHKVSKEGEYPMTGLTASPALTRHNRSGQYLFVNRRPVICPALSYAVRDGYGTRIGADRHPVYLLHISIPPELVDVNVHPQKREIRLREESVVKYAVHSAITQALGDVESTYSFSSDFAPFSFSEGPDFSEPLTFREEEPAALLHQEMPLETELRIIGLYRDYLFVEAESLSANLVSVDFSVLLSRFSASFCGGSIRKLIQPPQKESKSGQNNPKTRRNPNPQTGSESFPRRFSFGPGIIWVDLPAAQSRLQFDALMRSSENPMSQGLLIPVPFTCSRAEAQLLQTHVESLHKLGIQVREIGQTVFLVDSIPPFLEEGEVSAVLEELIAEMQVGEDMHRRLASHLCQRVRKRKKNYHLAEAVYLLKQLLQSDDPLHCPQGKRTMVFVEEREIENQFSGAIEAFAKRNEASKAQLLSDRTAP